MYFSIIQGAVELNAILCGTGAGGFVSPGCLMCRTLTADRKFRSWGCRIGCPVHVGHHPGATPGIPGCGRGKVCYLFNEQQIQNPAILAGC